MADADVIRDANVPDRPPAGDPAREPPGSPVPATADPDRVMSLVDHLAELRDRLIRSILAVGAGSVIGFLASERVIAFLRSALPTEEPLIMLGVGDAFAIRLRIAVVIGVILAMPVILYQLWAFISPGLTPGERRVVRPWVPLALLFFALGVGIAYVVLPFAATFLLSFQTPDLKAQITAGNYFDFVSTMFLAFGLLMEFPILLYGLSRVGIVSSARLAGSRRFAILAIAVFAAAATPGGDLVSPIVLGLVMYLLFEGTLIAIRRSGR